MNADEAARTTPPPLGKVHLHFAYSGKGVDRGRWLPWTGKLASPLCDTIRCRPVLIREA